MMKLILYFFIVACTFERVSCASLRGQLKSTKDASKDRNLKEKENVQKEVPVFDLQSLSLKDEYAPSFSPTVLTSDWPSINPTLVPSDSPSTGPTVAPTDVPTVSAAPSSPPYKLTMKSDTYSGKDPSGKTFRIDIRFDSKYKSNAWHVFQGTGAQKKVLYGKDFGQIESSGLHKTLFVDMPSGPYTFVIADIGNDGISGKITLYKVAEGKADALIWEEQGDFGFLLEKTFFIQ